MIIINVIVVNKKIELISTGTQMKKKVATQNQVSEDMKLKWILYLSLVKTSKT